MCSNRIAGGLCKSWRQALWLNRDSWYWQHMCTWLGEEDIVHVSDDIVRAHEGGNYRELFDDFWDMRREWLSNVDHVESMDMDAHADDADDFTIHVSCRLRPSRPAGDVATMAGANKVTVPLHQRIALVKAKNAKGGGSKMSTKEAMRIITNQERVAPQHASSPSPAGMDESRETAATVMMIPPASEENEICGEDNGTIVDTDGAALSDNEENDAHADGSHNESEVVASILDVDERCGRLLTLCPSVGVRAFTFQSLMTAPTTNEECYTRSRAHAIVNDFLNGKSGAIVVYGQTGSGKTYTMFGSGTRTHRRDGVVQMACKEVVTSLTRRSRRYHASEIAGGDIGLKASFVEVYGNDVFDLLGGGERVGQNRVAGQRYVLDGHTSRSIHCAGDLDSAITSGLQYRSVGSHEMNAASSRSHTILILEYYERRWTPGDGANGERLARTRHSKLMFVDLGGSEKIHKSKVNDGISSAGSCTWSAYYEQRKRLYETININTGLFALKRCIDALNARQEVFEEWASHPINDDNAASEIHSSSSSNRRRHLPHVPYADSRLTMILASVLSADARSTANSGKIALIVTADGDDANAVETIQTLRFGEHVSRVKHAHLLSGSGGGEGGGVQSGLESVLAQMDGEIERLAGLIRDKERWVVKKETSVDPIDGTRLVKTVTVLEGAEDLHKEIDAIVKRRDQILLKCG